MSEIASSPHTVYRVYAEQGALLYIGLTATHKLGLRLNQHRGAGTKQGSPWMICGSLVTTEPFPDRASGRVAEAAAIRAERPLFNVQHNTPQGERRLPLVIRPHLTASAA